MGPAILNSNLGQRPKEGTAVLSFGRKSGLGAQRLWRGGGVAVAQHPTEESNPGVVLVLWVPFGPSDPERYPGGR